MTTMHKYILEEALAVINVLNTLYPIHLSIFVPLSKNACINS